MDLFVHHELVRHERWKWHQHPIHGWVLQGNIWGVCRYCRIQNGLWQTRRICDPHLLAWVDIDFGLASRMELPTFIAAFGGA